MPRRSKKPVSYEHFLFTIAVFAIAFGGLSIFSNIFKLSITGAETGYANVTINETVGITLVTDGINFTSAGPNDYRESNNTADIEPDDRINMSNTGNRPVNVTVQTTTDLFTSFIAATDTNFKCMTDICNGMVDGASGEAATECLPSPWNNTYTDCDSSATGTPVHAIANLSFKDGQDSAVLEISIIVPASESGGTKQAILSLTASDSLV